MAKRGNVPFRGKSQDDARQRVQIAQNAARAEASRKAREAASKPSTPKEN